MHGEKQEKETGMKIVIVGGVAAGSKAASRIGRICPEAEIVMYEKGDVLSYAACGLPYYVEGKVADADMLVKTPNGTLRDHKYFEKVKNVKTHVETEVLSIDTVGKTLEYRNLKTNRTGYEDYDKLVLAIRDIF